MLGACSALGSDGAAPTETTVEDSAATTPTTIAPDAMAFSSEVALATATVSDLDLRSLKLGDPSQRLVLDLLYDGLVEIDPISGELVPALATT